MAELKKNQKKAPAKDYSPFAGWFPRRWTGQAVWFFKNNL